NYVSSHHGFFSVLALICATALSILNWTSVRPSSAVGLGGSPSVPLFSIPPPGARLSIRTSFGLMKTSSDVSHTPACATASESEIASLDERNFAASVLDLA